MIQKVQSLTALIFTAQYNLFQWILVHIKCDSAQSRGFTLYIEMYINSTFN